MLMSTSSKLIEKISIKADFITGTYMIFEDMHFIFSRTFTPAKKMIHHVRNFLRGAHWIVL